MDSIIRIVLILLWARRPWTLSGIGLLFFCPMNVMVFATLYVHFTPVNRGGWAPGWSRRKSRLKIEGQYTFNAPRERVWQVLLDPKVMAQCMPGCESMNEVAPDRFETVMKVGVASVKGTYKGKVSIKDKQAPSHYVLSGEGSGGPGFMQGDVSIDLEEASGQTVLKYSTDPKIGGLIASVGQRMLNGVAKMMADQFFKKVETFI
jgi:hypothetical protein